MFYIIEVSAIGYTDRESADAALDAIQDIEPDRDYRVMEFADENS